MNDAESIICRSYTYARKFPLVIGKIAGWVPIWGPATPTQYAVGTATAAVLVFTRDLWMFVPGPHNIVIAVGVPFLLAWFVRSARIENRPPLRFLYGALVLLCTPPNGVRQGWPVFERRQTRLTSGWIFVSTLPPQTPGA